MKLGGGTVEFSRLVEDGGTSLGRASLLSTEIL